MKAVEVVEGTVCPLDRTDVDTDQIIPKQFLKRIERSGFGPFAFYDWRYADDGRTPRPDFPMNRPEHQGARVLLTGANFGCGSSREHAPWALEDAGFDAVIAPSFADIFRNNCSKTGLLTVDLSPEEVRELFDLVAADPSLRVRIDLDAQRVTAERAGAVVFDAGFDIDPFVKHRLLNGLDDIDLTLAHEDDISRFEQQRPAYKPRLTS